MLKFDKYISPLVKVTETEKNKMHKTNKAISRNTALALNHTESTRSMSHPRGQQLLFDQEKILEMLGPNPILTQGQFQCIQQKYPSSKKSKDPVLPITLHRKINMMGRVIEKQEKEISELKNKVLQSNQFRLGSSACCCDELRQIYHQKEDKLMQLSEYWKNQASFCLQQVEAMQRAKKGKPKH